MLLLDRSNAAILDSRAKNLGKLLILIEDRDKDSRLGKMELALLSVLIERKLVCERLRNFRFLSFENW